MAKSAKFKPNYEAKKQAKPKRERRDLAQIAFDAVQKATKGRYIQ
jgi:hypothetical protein